MKGWQWLVDGKVSLERGSLTRLFLLLMQTCEVWAEGIPADSANFLRGWLILNRDRSVTLELRLSLHVICWEMNQTCNFNDLFATTYQTLQSLLKPQNLALLFLVSLQQVNKVQVWKNYISTVTHISSFLRHTRIIITSWYQTLPNEYLSTWQGRVNPLQQFLRQPTNFQEPRSLLVRTNCIVLNRSKHIDAIL